MYTLYKKFIFNYYTKRNERCLQSIIVFIIVVLVDEELLCLLNYWYSITQDSH